MGVSTYAVSGIGVVIDLAELAAPPTLSPSCEHPGRIGQKYCPECGTFVEMIVDDNDFLSYIQEYLEDAKLPKGYICHRIGYDTPTWFIGWGVSLSARGDDVMSKIIPNIPTTDAIREVLNNFLAIMQTQVEELPDDLLNEEIGFFTGLYFS